MVTVLGIRDLCHSELYPRCPIQSRNGSVSVPPLDESPHLRVGGRLGKIEFADGYLGSAVVELKQIDRQIAFKLVTVEPALLQLKCRIIEHGDLHRTVPVQGLIDLTQLARLPSLRLRSHRDEPARPRPVRLR